VFKDAGLSLFPQKTNDLQTDCSCPDWSNPCKHIAAVYYLLGEEFDRDPFLLFTLRGMRREECMGLLDGASRATARKKTRSRTHSSEVVADTSLPPEPLTAEVAGFWQGSDVADELCGEVRLPPVPAALPKRLGNFPFWRGTERFLEALEPIYTQAAPSGLRLFLGERENTPGREAERE
jgi:uncharacterized Zn finger protein